MEKARPIKVERKIHIWNIDITNDDGKMVAVSRLTLAVVDKK